MLGQIVQWMSFVVVHSGRRDSRVPGIDVASMCAKAKSSKKAGKSAQREGSEAL